MPHYCYLKADLQCPRCKGKVTDEVSFQWGYSSGRYWPEDEYYRLNDQIRWRYCVEGGLFSWVSFHSALHTSEGMNLGDPHLRNLVVLDTESEFGWGECGSCRQSLSGAAIEIRDNRILRAWLHEPGEFDGEADIYLVRGEEQLVPITEWREHATPAVQGCSEWRLVVPYVENGFLIIPKSDNGP